MRILYIHATMVPPPVQQDRDRFLLLSEQLEGDVLQPVWFRTSEEIEAIFGPGSYPVYTVGRFRYHWFPVNTKSGKKSRPEYFWFYLKTGLRICRERKIRCIVVYAHMTTALCAVLLKIASGTRLVIEIMTSPDRAYLFDRPNTGFVDRLRHIYSVLCLHVSVWFSDRTHLLFPRQLDPYPLLRTCKTSVFHDFTPLSGITVHQPATETNQRIMLVGSPWFCKGVDIAVEAFRRLAPDFPAAILTIVGNFPGGEVQALAAGCPAIELTKALPHHELMQVVSNSAIMLVSSRNEGLPRVLIEGMAAGLPLVGSDLAGIPTLIRDGENGFLFPIGDVSALENCLRKLLSDPALRKRMGERNYELAKSGLTERAYTEEFVRMIANTIGETAG